MNIWLERFGKWAGENLNKIYNIQCIIGVVAGLFLMYLAYAIGYTHFSLIKDGNRIYGKIIDFEFHSVAEGRGSTSTSFRPIVEFQVKNKTVRFKDWIGRQSNSIPDGIVPVIYNSSDPTIAMIDRPVWNWMPWAPIFIVGLFLFLVSVKNWLKHSLQK